MKGGQGFPPQHPHGVAIHDLFIYLAQLSGYFTQEFMVEDMKNMMVDLNAKVLEIESKLTYMTGSRETITEECKVFLVIGRLSIFFYYSINNAFF